MGLLEDGGNIYVNGHTQGDCYITGSWLWNYPGKSAASLYFDNGSSGWTAKQNVVSYTSLATNWLYLSGDSHNILVADNYHDSTHQNVGGTSNTVEDNALVTDSTMPASCKDIISASGPHYPGSPYPPIPHNIAFRKPATASSEYSPDSSALMAVDGDSQTAWSADGNSASSSSYLEVGLLVPAQISQVHILHRRDLYDAGWTTNFEVRASNH
jgi:hypothetical protein